MEVNHHLLWIWAKEILNFNNKKLLRLIQECGGTIFDVYHCEDFSSHHFLTEKEVQALIKKDLRNAWEIFGDCEMNQIGILTLDDSCYPTLLKEIENPPSPLFFKGHLLSCLERPMLTIAGTRQSNGYSEEKTKAIATALCHCGFTIVCGIANGIDSFACESAIRTDSGPIVVLPFGILSSKGASTRFFPDILKHGAIVSEIFPRNGSHAYSYHERNRILSGLSAGTFIPQAPKRSGALMTANYACEQNRDLFALLSNASEATEGSNRLIKDGCFPVTDFTDILNVYLPRYANKLKEAFFSEEKVFSLQDELTQDKLIAYRQKHSKKLDEKERIVFNLLTTEESTSDYIIENAELPVQEVLQILTTLEYQGLIVSCPGDKYKVIL